MSQTIIREMTECDWPAAAKIYQSGIETNLATFETKVPLWTEWDNAHLKKCRFVAEVDRRTAGWIALSPVSGRYCYRGVAEVSVYISPDFKRKGVGTILMNKMIEESEKAGIWLLQSSIIENNQASLKLHKRCGFRIVGYREKIAKDANGTWQNTILTERRNNIQ